jgi:hypothetical protein
MAKGMFDGITSLYNSLVNKRSASNTNSFDSQKMSESEMRALIISGLGNRIVSLIVNSSLNDTIQFDDKDLESFYTKRLAKAVKKASRFQIGFGRSILVINEIGQDLSKPRSGEVDLSNVKFDVFGGDMVYVGEYGRNLSDSRYYLPILYTVRAHQIHHSRVIDFTYTEPSELDKVIYHLGGVSLFEQIRTQLINDGVIERAGATIVEKNSSLFYMVDGLKESMASGNESDLQKYFGALEDGRSISGAGLIDKNDDVKAVNQTLADYDKVSENALRRIAMVTGIPVSVLVGESVRGMNSTGDNEKQTFNETVTNHQSEFLLDNINELLYKLGKDDISFKDNQGATPAEKVQFESVVIANAKLLAEMGEEFSDYLEQYDIIEQDDFKKVFPDENS